MSLQTKRIAKISMLVGVLLSTSTSIFSADLQTTHISDTNKTQSVTSTTSQAYLEWEITEEEYSRYQELMKGIRGSISPDNISPIEVLGIHARSDAERTKYARMWADAMEKDTQRILAFNRAYNQAWVEKGSPDLVDISKLELGNANPTAEKTLSAPAGNANNLLLVTMIAECKPCDDRLQKALTALQIDRRATLDIYFIDSENAEKSVIRQWAAQKRIEVDLLKNKRISLNHGRDIADKLKLNAEDLPAVFKKKETGGVNRVE